LNNHYLLQQFLAMNILVIMSSVNFLTIDVKKSIDDKEIFLCFLKIMLIAFI